MKSTVAILTLVFSFTAAFANTNSCPSNWSVVIIEKQNADKEDISIRVAENLIQDQQLSGDVVLAISSRFSPYTEIKGNDVQLSMVNKKLGKTVEEKWTSLGTVIETQNIGGEICHNVKILSGIVFKETKESSQQDCMFLPKSMCGKIKTNKLVIEKNINGKLYSLDSITSISRN